VYLATYVDKRYTRYPGEKLSSGFGEAE